MRNNLWSILVIGAVTLLCGCGSTSQLKPVPGLDSAAFQKYRTISVKDFSVKPGLETDATHSRLEEAGKSFADRIATALEQTKAFDQVSRDPAPAAGSLQISGEITRFVEGNPGLRLWIGMGAGSSYFDAKIAFRDADTGQSLGEVIVDKNSWGLGGGLAASQTVDYFMQQAAKKIAGRVTSARVAK